MEQNKDQSGAAVRGEAVAESEPTGLPPISMSTYGTKTACELEHLRRTQRVGPDNLPRWVDNMKGSDPTIDSLIEYIVSARAADAPSEPSEPPRLDTEESREYLVTFMEQHFTDTTFHRYIRGQIGGSGPLAGDFAWQMARALRRIEAGVVKSRAADALDSQPTKPIGYISEDALTELQDPNAPDNILTLRHAKSKNRNATIPVYLSAVASSQPTDGGVRNG